jgi:hypothetical protein
MPLTAAEAVVGAAVAVAVVVLVPVAAVGRKPVEVARDKTRR